MPDVSAESPKPFFIALLILGGTLCFAILFVLIDILLAMDSPSSGAVGGFLAAMGVGQYLAGKRSAPLPRKTKWLAAGWYTLLTLALGGVLLALDAALNPELSELASLSAGLLLVIAGIAVVLSLPLTYAGLLVGEKAAARFAAKRA